MKTTRAAKTKLENKNIPILIMKIGIGIILFLILTIIGMRGCLIEASNFLAANNNIICGTAQSPNGKYVLTIYYGRSLTPGEQGKTYFYLHQKDEKLEFPEFKLFSRSIFQPKGNILVMDELYFPYGIVWKDDHNLIINLKVPIETEYLLYGHYKVKIYSVKKNQWDDVKIIFGLSGEKKYLNEIKIEKPPAL